MDPATSMTAGGESSGGGGGGGPPIIPEETTANVVPPRQGDAPFLAVAPRGSKSAGTVHRAVVTGKCVGVVDFIHGPVVVILLIMCSYKM